MKRTICLILSILMIFALTACGSDAKSVDVQAQADAFVAGCTFDAAMSAVSTDELGFYFDVPEGTEIAGYMAEGTSTEIVVCANCKSADDAKALEASFQSYVADQLEQASRYQPEEVDRINTGNQTRQSGTNAILVICADTANVDKILGGF